MLASPEKSLQRLLKLVHTVRHLRPQQIYGRVWFRLHKPRPDLSPAPPRRVPSVAWASTGWRGPSLLGPMTYRFLSVERQVRTASDWDRPSDDKLWRYNLHYFDDLDARDASARVAWHRALIERWVRENPPVQGTGWEPYPVSLRLVNWCKWCLTGNDLAPEALHSMAVQARFLAQRLEIHLLGNHLLANLKALLFAGAFFGGEEADRWRRVAQTRLRSELREQILADGGHFERSPMYHAIMLEDVLDLMQLDAVFPWLLQAELVECLRLKAREMLDWLRVMTHPDAQISLFNDSAFEIAPTLAVLQRYAAHLGVSPAGSDGIGTTLLEHSGYARLASSRLVLLADVGEIGPAYLPGHAHADTLSFELSIDKHRWVVDSGTSRYDVSTERLFQRSTRAHNTVEVAGLDSSEVWSSFRVARRALPRDVRVWRSGAALWLTGAHDGYLRLPKPVLHRRTFQLEENALRIRDEIEGKVNPAVARFHLHPSVDARIVGSDAVELRAFGTLVNVRFFGAARIERQPATWHPRFGVSEPNQVLAVSFAGSSLETQFRLEEQG